MRILPEMKISSSVRRHCAHYRQIQIQHRYDRLGLNRFLNLCLGSQCGPAQRYGPVGGRRLKSGLFNRYVIVGILEVLRHNHADWHMIVLSIIARRRAQSVAVSISRKIREKDATGSRKKRLGYTRDYDVREA